MQLFESLIKSAEEKGSKDDVFTTERDHTKCVIAVKTECVTKKFLSLGWKYCQRTSRVPSRENAGEHTQTAISLHKWRNLRNKIKEVIWK